MVGELLAWQPRSSTTCGLTNPLHLSAHRKQAGAFGTGQSEHLNTPWKPLVRRQSIGQWCPQTVLLLPGECRLHPRNLHLVETISEFDSMVTRNTHDEMECYMVDTWVNNPAHDTPECLAPKKENPPTG